MTRHRPGRQFLHTPGPTHIPDRVQNAMHVKAVDFASPEFMDVAVECFEGLKPLFGLHEGEVFIYTASGHGAWEAAFVNLFEPGDTVLMPETGRFSRVWGEMGEALGLEIVTAENDWRTAIEPNHIEEVLRDDAQGKIKAVLMVHTETATGVTSDVPAVRRAINASRMCGGCVFFPPGQYQFHTTVEIGGGCFKGGGFSVPQGGVDGNSQPQVNIYGPNPGGPAIAIIDAGSGVMMQDLTFWGGTTAIYIGNSAGIRFVNVGAGAGADGDGVNTTAAGCNATGCNVVLGSMSAAMVVENSVRVLAHTPSLPCVHVNLHGSPHAVLVVVRAMRIHGPRQLRPVPTSVPPSVRVGSAPVRHLARAVLSARCADEPDQSARRLSGRVPGSV